MTYQEQINNEIKNANNVKNIKTIVSWLIFDSSNSGFDSNNAGYELLKLVSKNASDFTKDIADKFIEKYDSYESRVDELSKNGQEVEYELSLSEKQQWCVAYQVFNNKTNYIN